MQQLDPKLKSVQQLNLGLIIWQELGLVLQLNPELRLVI